MYRYDTTIYLCWILKVNSMILTTLEQSDYDRLVEIQRSVPALTFEHEPYQEWIPSTFTESDLEAHKEVSSIIKKAIGGFKKFTNFFYNKKGELCIRFYYDWSLEWDNEENKIPVRKGNSIAFNGVGYLHIDELLNSFRK